jgi:RND superfamily putative drug exporter
VHRPCHPAPVASGHRRPRRRAGSGARRRTLKRSFAAEADPPRDAGLTVGFGGYLGQKVSKPDTHSSEAVGLTMAVIVLLLTFGTVVAMGLPIVTAIIGLVSGASIITLISQVSEVPTVAPWTTRSS